MIKPTKYTNINLSVIGLSTEILKLFKDDNVQKYDQILGKIIYRKGKQSRENFLLALSFLYLMGKVKYHPKEDVFEFLFQ